MPKQKHGTATNDQYGQVLTAFIIAIATAIKDFSINDIISSLSNQGSKLTQCLRLTFTALITGQDLLLASDEVRTSRPSVLEAIGIRAVEAVKEFIAKDHFKVGTTKGVKISYVSDNFKKHFLGKVETGIGAAKLRVYKLLVRSLDHLIRTDLGDNHATFLSDIWDLMAAQPNGEEGSLLNDGSANIFYVQDDDGIFWAVNVYWSGDGWYVNANSVGYPDGWYADGQVFGR